MAAMPEENPEENPSADLGEMTGAAEAGKREPEEFQAFHSGETVTINFGAEAAEERTQISQDPSSEAKEAKKEEKTRRRQETRTT